jgi:hypothetical protein
MTRNPASLIPDRRAATDAPWTARSPRWPERAVQGVAEARLLGEGVTGWRQQGYGRRAEGAWTGIEAGG